jgi:hypothetical protein
VPPRAAGPTASFVPPMDDAALRVVGETALDRFIETFNSRQAASWAASLSYPHVRVSPRQAAAAVTPDERAYAGAVTYDAADAMGWHHSAWDSKRILAVSPSKIHASAQWCRYDAAGQRILENNVSYVITEVEGRWGIQARFGVDSAPPEDPDPTVDRARAVWDRLWEAAVQGDAAGLDEIVALPCSLIGVGRITVAATPAELVDHLAEGLAGTTAGVAAALQVGRLGVNLGAEYRAPGGDSGHALSLVVLTEHGARVSALSLLRGARVFAP